MVDELVGGRVCLSGSILSLERLEVILHWSFGDVRVLYREASIAMLLSRMMKTKCRRC